MNDEARAYTREGITLFHQGRLDEAAGCFEKALRLQPEFAQGYNNLANVFLFQGRYHEAIANYRKTLELLPDDPGILNNLSYAYSKSGNAQDAEECARRALRLRPNFPEAHNHLGIALVLQERLAEAEASYRECLRLLPQFARVHANLAQVLVRQRRLEDAVAHAAEAIRLDPQQAEPHNVLCSAYLHLHKLDEALASGRQARQLNPRLPEASFNLASVYFARGQLAEAGAACQEVLRLQADFIEVESILGGVALKECRFDDARASFERFLARKPEDAQGHFNRAMVLLGQGNFDEGWPEYEWRWRWQDFVVRPFTRPMWDGSPVAGKTVLLHAEQGLGDTLQFIRYAPLVQQLGATVIVACQEVLQKLLSRCPGVDRLVAQETFTEPVDEHVPLLSLPGILKTTSSTIPARIPYIFAEPSLVAQWRRELRLLPEFKIGIAWQGNPKHPDDRFRSIPLAHFAPLAQVPGTRWLSLQKGPGLEQLANASFAITDLSRRLDETAGAFMDTAAVMMSLDLVITSDSAVAHLAGALGVPVWVLLPFAADWRWLLERADSPWYPTMRLFRQRRRGAWQDVFAIVASELAEHTRRAADVSPQPDPPGVAIPIEVTPGELIDKITILHIKRARIAEPDKLRHIVLELATLEAARDRFLASSPELLRLADELQAVNQALWNIEDDLRTCEKTKDFGVNFVELARSVYRQNDLRATLKRQINELLGARWHEEKSYAEYH